MNQPKLGDLLVQDFLTWYFFPLTWAESSPERIALEASIDKYLNKYYTELSDEQIKAHKAYFVSTLYFKMGELIANSISPN